MAVAVVMLVVSVLVHVCILNGQNVPAQKNNGDRDQNHEDNGSSNSADNYRVVECILCCFSCCVRRCCALHAIRSVARLASRQL